MPRNNAILQDELEKEPSRYPLRSILAATALGVGSDAIVRSAAILAQRTGAELHLLHSLELPFVPSDDVMRRTGFFGQIETAEEQLQEQVERTMPPGVHPASQKVIIYIAHKAIRDLADEVSADLIVMGPHRGGATGARFLGTTADRVVRTVDVPCLIVEEPLTIEIERIGVAVDFSEPSLVALETALAWGLQLTAGMATERGRPPEIRVMHVGNSFEQADNPDLEAGTIRPELERQVKRSVASVAGAESLDVQIGVVWANNAAEAMVGWAKNREIDLLAMGTHGTSWFGRALIGSMASSVARQTPCPVLLVPPKGSYHEPPQG